MPLIDPELIKKARVAVEKRADPLIGAIIGAGASPSHNKIRGALRGAGVGLATETGAGMGGLLGGGAGFLGGGVLGGGLGAGASALGQLAAQGEISPHALALHAGAGALAGSSLGTPIGGLGGLIAGGLKGYRLGKEHIWEGPWDKDRERPHGVSGADADDDDDDEKKASFATRLGQLAALRTRK